MAELTIPLMKIERIQGKNMEVTDAIERYVRKRVAVLRSSPGGYSPPLLVWRGKPSEHHNKGTYTMRSFRRT